MRKCNVEPYEGNEPYVFISYSHKDKGRVFPVLEYMASIGIRIWYDNGIHPGDNWLETIGNKLNDCAVFISFISNNSLSSHNCKNELNFAVIENKTSLSVILEPVEFSIALRMQLASIQGIVKYDHADYSDYLECFKKAPCLNVCKGEPNSNIVVGEEWNEPPAKVLPPAKKAMEWFSEAESMEASSKSVIKSVRSTSDDEDEEEITIAVDDDDSKTVPMDEDPRLQLPAFYLIKEDDGEKIKIIHNEFKIGRKKSTCDYVVEDTLKKISREHMIFVFQEDKCFVKDNGAVNKTYLNDIQLEPHELYEINEGDKLVMASDQFTFRVGRE